MVVPSELTDVASRAQIYNWSPLPQGACSALLDAEALGIAPAELSARFSTKRSPPPRWTAGAATLRRATCVRCFGNQPVDRLRTLGDRVRRSDERLVASGRPRSPARPRPRPTSSVQGAARSNGLP